MGNTNYIDLKYLMDMGAECNVLLVNAYQKVSGEKTEQSIEEQEFSTHSSQWL